MKTPKRESNLSLFDLFADPELAGAKCARWKRKNRIKQLKRSLTRYKDATNLPKYSHELRAYKLLQHLKKPGKNATMFEWTSYIHRLQEITFQMELALIAACISAGQHLERRKNRKTLATHKTAESGQQAELPPTGGQQNCIAQNAENATQGNLLCSDAEQQPARKDQE